MFVITYLISILIFNAVITFCVEAVKVILFITLSLLRASIAGVLIKPF